MIPTSRTATGSGTPSATSSTTASRGEVQPLSASATHWRHSSLRPSSSATRTCPEPDGLVGDRQPQIDQPAEPAAGLAPGDDLEGQKSRAWIMIAVP